MSLCEAHAGPPPLLLPGNLETEAHIAYTSILPLQSIIIQTLPPHKNTSVSLSCVFRVVFTRRVED